MTGLTYDTGALLAAEANDRRMWALHRRALERLHTPTVPAATLAQAWRGGPQPLLSRILDGCVIEALDEPGARVVGQLLARSNTTDVVDASVAAGALRRGDAVVTSDQRDIETLAGAVGRRVNIIAI
jgi:predicted nucleic acid-binding protein